MACDKQPAASGERHEQPAISRQTPRDALLAALNELLEAERAGARVAMETARDMPAGTLTTLVHDIHRDEVHWCSMLMRTIASLDGTASSATGAFWGKAMAIPDLAERLRFLNRGQAWVIRKLQALLAGELDPAIRADLSRMREAHRVNIDRVNASDTTGPDAGSG
jgi:hypothetical protein